MQVVTYQFAYVAGEVSLCESCAEAPPAELPPLGRVSHGLHDGQCAGCQARVTEEEEEEP